MLEICNSNWLHLQSSTCVLHVHLLLPPAAVNEGLGVWLAGEGFFASVRPEGSCMNYGVFGAGVLRGRLR